MKFVKSNVFLNISVRMRTKDAENNLQNERYRVSGSCGLIEAELSPGDMSEQTVNMDVDDSGEPEGKVPKVKVTASYKLTKADAG